MKGKSEIYLDELVPHHCAAVTRVTAEGEEMARLMAMGVCGGRVVELIQTGDPLIVKVLGTRIGISARLARNVLVNPDPHAACPVQPPLTSGAVGDTA